MARKEEAPTIETREDGEEIQHHPAFVQISASRVSGGKILYGSDFQHQNYVTIKVRPSQMRRSLSEDNPFGANRAMIEVCLSEAQWATFVSSMNVGFGTPATLQSFNGEDIPNIERQPSRRHKFTEEAEAKTDATREHLAQLSALINTSSKLSGKDKKEMLWKIQSIERGLGSSIDFILKQFNEYMEHTVEKARSEIVGTAQAVLVKTGLSKLMGAKPKVLGIDLEKEADSTE